MDKLLSQLYEKFYSQFPHYTNRAPKEETIKGIKWMLKEYEYRGFNFDDVGSCILMGITGKWDHCDNFSLYNVRKWFEGYDKDFKAKERKATVQKNQAIGDDYKPTERDRDVGTYSILIRKFMNDTGKGAISQSQARGVNIDYYKDKITGLMQWQKEASLVFLKMHRPEESLTKWLEEHLK